MTDTAPDTFRFTRRGRSRATALAILITWTVCLFAATVLKVAPWIIVIVLLFTFPALWDIWKNTSAGLVLNPTRLTWHTGSLQAQVEISEIDHIRLVTRLDLSVRAAVVLTSKRKLRIPPEATPPHRDFEAALHAIGISTKRHHFTIL